MQDGALNAPNCVFLALKSWRQQHVSLEVYLGL